MNAILQTFEGLQRVDYYNPSTLRRTVFTILGRIVGLHFQSFKGLMHYMWSLDGLKDCIHSPSPFQGSQMQSFEGLKDCVWSLNPSKDYKFNPSKDWRNACANNPSKGWRIAHVILQPFEGLHSKSLEELKDCIHSPSKGWGIMYNPWRTWRITFIILRRVEGLCLILQAFQGLQM